MVGSVRVWSLRELKDVIIPEGTERIGNHWFYGCDIKSAEIPASVKCIDASAFYECKNLKRVVLAEESRLEKIGNRCFASSGIEEITLPCTVREIGGYAFFACDSLKTIYVEDGCEASFVHTCVPGPTRIISLSTTLIGGMGI